MASSVIAKSGLPKNKRQNKALIDKISATIILQDYFKSLNVRSWFYLSLEQHSLLEEPFQLPASS